MEMDRREFEFPEHEDENRRIWDANAWWWDDQIGDGNEFQTYLIEPATERLLALTAGEVVLDVACGAGRFARRMAALGARVVAFDCSARFIERARARTPPGIAIEYHSADGSDVNRILTLGINRFDKAVCTMALMDMPQVKPLFSALAHMLKPGGAFVFSVTHPCFHTAAIQRFAEMYEDLPGRHIIHTGVKVSSYLTPFAKKTEGIIGQPEPQYYFHRPIQSLFQASFDAGFVVDGIEEPGFPKPDRLKAGVRWSDMPEIPPVMVVRAAKMGT